MLKTSVVTTASPVLTLTKAILLYGTAQSVSHATIHPVDITGGRPRIQAGAPVSKKALQEYIASLAKLDPEANQFLDEHILCRGSGFLLWWRKPQKTRLWFRNAELNKAIGKTETDEKTLSVEVNLPGMVFLVHKRSLHVMFVKGDRRPTRTSELFHTSLMNVWTTTEVCTGNVLLPEKVGVSNTKQWEDVLFASHFTHFNDKTEADYEGGRLGLTKDLVLGTIQSIPESSFSPLKKTIEKLINGLSKS